MIRYEKRHHFDKLNEDDISIEEENDESTNDYSF